jgi:quercetin dioxygenase-like cupin family protein
MMQDAPPKVVMVQDEPRHRQVFHQGPVRILDVQIPPGDVTLYHTHDTAILYVPISLSPTDTQILGEQWLGVLPTDKSRFEGLVVATDTSYATKPRTHRVKNVGSRPFRLIAITNAANPEAPSTTTPPGSPAHLSPWYAATSLVPGRTAEAPWSAASAPTVVVLPGPGTVMVDLTDGSRVLDRAGTWVVVDSGSRYRVSSPDGASVVLVQVNW